jgi:DNA repair exonuclease SbcCD nuclease subunit
MKNLETLNFRDNRGFIFLGDIHEERVALDEITQILQEVVNIARENNCNTFFQLGDICDKIRLEPDELYKFCEHIRFLNDQFEYFGIIEGNHDKFHNKMSIISFLKFFGVNIFNDELLINSTYGKILLGHWFLDKSKGSFGTHHRYTVEELQQSLDFTYCLLGHAHDFQQINNKIYHVGSARWVNFGEDQNIEKRCVVLNDKGLKFIKLKSPIPIYNVSSVDQLKKLPPRCKVRYLFKSFSNLVEETKIVNQLKDNFYDFRKKIDFQISNIDSNDIKFEKKSESDIINEWLKKVDNIEVRNILTEEFSKEIK